MINRHIYYMLLSRQILILIIFFAFRHQNIEKLFQDLSFDIQLKIQVWRLFNKAFSYLSHMVKSSYNTRFKPSLNIVSWIIGIVSVIVLFYELVIKHIEFIFTNLHF